MTDYRGMYEAKNREFEELTEQYNELEEQTNMIINDLEEEIKQLKRKSEALSRENTEQKVWISSMVRIRPNCSRVQLKGKLTWLRKKGISSRRNS